MGKGTSFVIGAAVGAIAALLLTPNSGERNRELVAEKVDYYSAHGGEVFQNAAGTVRDKVRGAGDGATESADDIKRKINEARDRIAEQVTRNREAEEAESGVGGAGDGEHEGFVASEPQEPEAE